MVQIDMAFVGRLARDKRTRQHQEEQRPQVQIDDKTRPLCDRVGHMFELGTEGCIFCGLRTGRP